MELPVIHLYVPTHRPVEQLASFRAMPGTIDLRPGDANEIAAAWLVIMPLRHDPVALVLSRQAMPTLDRTKYASADGVGKGAYVLAGDPHTTPDIILIATGTELGLAVPAYEQLTGVMPASCHAVIRAVRPARPGLPRRGPTTVGHRPGRHGTGLLVRLAPLGRCHRRNHSESVPSAHQPDQSTANQIRLHPRINR